MVRVHARSDPHNTKELLINADDVGAEITFQQIEHELKSGSSVFVSGKQFNALSVLQSGQHKDRAGVHLSPPHSLNELEILYRMRDVSLTLIALLLLAPVLGLISLLIWASSAGPVLYRTTVVGWRGLPFIWSKFRSMKFRPEDREDVKRKELFRSYVEQRRSGKVINPKQVTPIGRFLRRHSLDELPQLGSVLMGHMSLVGPRPCLPYEYELMPEWAKRRFRVRPGLTGLWQVYGRGRVSFEESLAMDACYSLVRSHWLDLKLILRTWRIVLTGKGEA